MDSIQEQFGSIGTQELQQLINAKKQQIKIIDVRSKEEYEQMHIPGAINIPTTIVGVYNDLFDMNDTIITVCGKGGGRSIKAFEEAKELGFASCYWLRGGTFGWFDSK